MSSKPKSDSQSGNSSEKQNKGKMSSGTEATSSERLPFEPAVRKKSAKKAPAPPIAQKQGAQKSIAQKNQSASPSVPVTAQSSAAIPQVVSSRMARRMAFFCGIPTTLGVLTFVVSYIVVTNQWFKLPNVAVVLVSMGFFGLGVLGLSYGVISASWDEERVGTRLGWGEFTTNFGRLTEAWRSTKKT